MCPPGRPRDQGCSRELHLWLKPLLKASSAYNNDLRLLFGTCSAHILVLKMDIWI